MYHLAYKVCENYFFKTNQLTVMILSMYSHIMHTVLLVMYSTQIGLNWQSVVIVHDSSCVVVLTGNEAVTR